MIAPHAPDFAGRDRHVGRTLDALDQRYQLADFHFAAENRFVADDDAVDVAVALGEVDDRVDFALVAGFVLVDPGADGDAHAQLGSRGRYEFDAAGR